ncbi:MAG TPA: hypothetical protein VGI93_09870 [Steroidobacteraceae bacterium]|jgi:hypothetical protein
MIAALVLTLGIASLAADHLNVNQPAIFNLHLLFGASLWLAVGSGLLRQRRDSDCHPGVQFYEYTRHLSRSVYILLYLLAGVRLVFHLSEVMNSAGAAVARGTSRLPGSLDDFQVYILYALVPFWVMRILARYVPARNGTSSAPIPDSTERCRPH